MLDRNKDKLLKTLLKATKQNRIKYKINYCYQNLIYIH